jgi:uncharacterized protein (TIGR00290 family)
MAEKIVLSWSGGKDSTLALERLIYNGGYVIEGLFTVYTTETQKVNLHNVPVSLIRMQAESLNLPLYEIALPEDASNEIYESEHFKLFEQLKVQGIYNIAFGDLFLDVIKDYRDKLAAKTGMKFQYPLWREQTGKISTEFIERGFKAVVTAINTDVLPYSLLGRQYDEDFVTQLPEDVDICGENGEFHTFVWDGPIFSKSVTYNLGEISTTDYRPKVEMSMAFIEILPG